MRRICGEWIWNLIMFLCGRQGSEVEMCRGQCFPLTIHTGHLTDMKWRYAWFHGMHDIYTVKSEGDEHLWALLHTFNRYVYITLHLSPAYNMHVFSSLHVYVQDLLNLTSVADKSGRDDSLIQKKSIIGFMHCGYLFITELWELYNWYVYLWQVWDQYTSVIAPDGLMNLLETVPI